MPKAKKLPSGSWNVKVYSHTTADGKMVRKSFTVHDPSPAGRRKCERLASEWADRKQLRKGSGLTFKQAAEKYIASREPVLSPTTIDGYRQLLSRYYPTLLNRQVESIHSEDAQALITITSRTHSPKTVRNVYGLFSAVMREYAPDTALRVIMPEKRADARMVPSEEQARAIIDAVRGTNLELPVLLAAFGPMRRGEICALRTENIDGCVVHVCENMVKKIVDHKNTWVIKQPKSVAGDRYIEYPEQVAKLWEGKKGRVVPMCPDTLTKSFAIMLKANGLPPMRFHDLRHYSASVMHAIGIPDAYIMARGGWGNDRTLKEVYRHTVAGAQKEATDKINSHFSDYCT